MRITIDQIREKMCDEHCHHPYQNLEDGRMEELFCDKCPLNDLPKWISCTDSIPQPHTDALISVNGRIIIAMYDGYSWYTEEVNPRRIEKQNVKAWMPLPEPYKEEEDGDSD